MKYKDLYDDLMLELISEAIYRDSFINLIGGDKQIIDTFRKVNDLIMKKEKCFSSNGVKNKFDAFYILNKYSRDLSEEDINRLNNIKIE